MSALVVSSRRIAAGIEPDAGATSRLPSWWGASDWTDEVAGALVEAGPDLLRAHHVSREAVMATARGMAAYADHRTGRDCRPTNARLVELTRFSLSVVQRARRVLKDLDLVVELIRGRSIMTRAERLAAWRRGSSHRQVASLFALCSRRARAPKVSTPEVGEGAFFGSAHPHPVERDTPPGATKESSLSHLRSTHLRRRTEKNEEESAPRSAPKDGVRGDGSGGAASRRLAAAVAGRLGWLAGVHPRRMTPTLARFARAGWTARDVDLAVRDALAARGVRVPAKLKTPAAYLAWVLRPLDPADRPTAAEDAARDLQRREDVYRLQLATGAPCAHGRPAGDVPSPLRGLLACPQCRTDREPAGW